LGVQRGCGARQQRCGESGDPHWINSGVTLRRVT
jgi:hypothetical protein